MLFRRRCLLPLILALSPHAGAAQDPVVEPPTVGPPAPEAPAPVAPSPRADPRWDGFGERAGTVKWEVAGFFAYTTVAQAIGADDVGGFRFKDEGWFGDSTINLGIDKLTHAWNAYLVSEVLGARIRRRTGDAPGAQVTAALLASGLAFYSELWDGRKVGKGFSIQDVLFNTAGAGLSVLRDEVPGLREKLDFRLLLLPNRDIYTFRGTRHYRQQRYLLALKLAGFERLRDTPLRFVELHAGYYATGFTARERARGEKLDQRPFVGIGLNLQQLFFRRPRTPLARAAESALDYVQLPYTAAHFH